MMWLRAFVVLILLVGSPALASAQAIGDDMQLLVEDLARDVTRLDQEADERWDDDVVLAEIAADLVALQDELVAAGVGLTPRLLDIRAELAQLGEQPPESEPAEPESVTARRTALIEERAAINALIGRLESQAVAARAIVDDISERRRALFAETLSRRYDITDAFGQSLVGDFGGRARSLELRVSSWLSFTWRAKQSAFLASLLAILALAVVAIWVTRRTIGAWIARTGGDAAPTYFARVTNAFWFTLLPTLVLWAFLAFSLFVLDRAGVMRADIFAILSPLLIGVAIVVLVWRLSEAVFAPSKPNWRLIGVTDRSARALKAFAVALAVVSVTDFVIAQINAVIGTSLAITVARSLIASVAVGGLLIIIAFIRPFPSADDAADGGRPGAWPDWVKWPLVVTGTVLIVAALAGYIGLARFASQQIVITGAILATMYLGYRASQAISQDHALAESRLGQMLANRYRMSETLIDQLGLLFGTVMTVIVLLVGLPILALMWGFRWPEIRGAAFRLFTDVPVGSISISITSILIGIALFFVGYFVTRRVQRWLDGNVLERSRIESGVRNSIRTAIGYLGIAIAALIAVSAAGFDLSQLALVAGALSLGIGFGLQNIVSNFVSGLILLAERPFKTGDIIEAGGYTGTVTNINVRATEIQLFDRKTLILPNSDLINSPVSNWMHRNTLGRVAIKVGVSYGSDPQKVYDILLEIAADHPRILGNPEPFVAFDDFGSSSLDFTLYAYLADIGYGLTVRTELRMAIFERFKAAGIEIPFPQRDVHLRMAEKGQGLPEPLAEAFGPIKTDEARRPEED